MTNTKAGNKIKNAVNEANWDFVYNEVIRLKYENEKLRHALEELIVASDGHGASYIQRQRGRELLEPSPFVAMNAGGINKAPE